MNVRDVFSHFNIPKSTDIQSVEQISSGHINQTFRVSTSDETYIIQEINPVFNVDAIAHNLELFEEVQKKAMNQKLLDPNWCEVIFLNVKGDDVLKKFFQDDEGYYWRGMINIEGNKIDSFQDIPEVERDRVAKKLGEVIARWNNMLNLIEVSKWKVCLPRFHDSDYHYDYLMKIISGELIQLSLSTDSTRLVVKNSEIMERYRHRIESLLEKIKCRKSLLMLHEGNQSIAHNDTKINNFIFQISREGFQPVCLIDLDTIQPADQFTDIADALRSSCSLLGEEPSHIDENLIQEGVIQSFIDGYLSEINVEGDRKTLLKSIMFMHHRMHFELACRFLADFVAGNPYFGLKSNREDLNLYRAEVQINLLETLESKNFLH